MTSLRGRTGPRGNVVYCYGAMTCTIDNTVAACADSDGKHDNTLRAVGYEAPAMTTASDLGTVSLSQRRSDHDSI